MQLWELAHRIARRKLGNDEDARDVAQAVLVRLIRKRLLHPGVLGPDGRPDAAALATLSRATAAETSYRVLDKFRASRRDARILAKFLWSIDGEDAPDVERLALVVDSFTDLQPKHRAVLIALDVMGLTGAEAAEHLSIPQGTVASQRRRALQLLRQAIERRGEQIAQARDAGESPSSANEAAAASAPLQEVRAMELDAAPSDAESSRRGWESVAPEADPSSNPPPDRGMDGDAAVAVIAASGADPEDRRS